MRPFLLLLTAIFSFAYGLDPTILDLEAKIFPKIILLDEEIDKKLVDGKVEVAIIYEKKYQKEAKRLAASMHNKIVLDKVFSAHAYLKFPTTLPSAYILVMDPERSEKIFDRLKHTKRLIISANPHGICSAAVSITIGPRVQPLVNPKIIKLLGLKFNPILFKVAKFYEK